MSPANAVANLPRDERRAITLQRVYGYRYVEIALRLHMDEAQVTKILAAAARHLADALYGKSE